MSDPVFDALGSMSPEELRKVRARVAFLLDGVDDAGSADSGAEREVYDAIRAALEARGASFASFAAFTKTAGYKTFRQEAPRIVDYVKKNFKVSRKNERVRVLFLLSELLLAWFDEARLVPGPRTICQQIGKIPVIVERAFPGYRESGLLPIVAKIKKGGVR